MQVSHRPFWHFPPVLVLAGGDLAEGGGGGGLKNGDNCPHAAWVLNCGHCSPYNAFLLFFFYAFFPSLSFSVTQPVAIAVDLSVCRTLLMPLATEVNASACSYMSER